MKLARAEEGLCRPAAQCLGNLHDFTEDEHAPRDRRPAVRPARRRAQACGRGHRGRGVVRHQCLQHDLEHDGPTLRYAIIEGRERMGGTWDLFRYPGVRSDSDMYTLGSRGEGMRALVPHVHLDYVEGAGHMLPLTAPDRVASFVRGWRVGQVRSRIPTPGDGTRRPSSPRPQRSWPVLLRARIFAERLEITEILEAAGAPLVAHQRLASEKRHRQPVHLMHEASGPRLLERQP